MTNGEIVRKAVLAFERLLALTVRGDVRPPNVFGMCDGCEALGLESNCTELADLHWHESICIDGRRIRGGLVLRQLREHAGMKNVNATATYPLQWPSGWPRSPEWDREEALKGGTFDWNQVVQRLVWELERMRARNIVISTNQPLRQDGLPYAAKRNIEDPGVAIYFEFSGKSLVMAQDRYVLLNDNVRSIALAIEGLRQVNRHGGGMMAERAFAGFEALPPPPTWWEILGVAQDAPIDEVRQAYRRAAQANHPDRGGNVEIMTEINRAWYEAQQR